VIGGPDLTMSEVNRVMEHLNSKCARAQVMMGAAIDEGFRERMAITVIAARRNEAKTSATVAGEAATSPEKLDAELFSQATGARPQSRVVPPPPAMTPEKMEQLMTRQTSGTARARKAAAKMRQGQLPLEIVSKGRFDKSEPTIHKGEDLDMPTYIRRGVALN
jgi:cell division protein FtsZ